MDKLELKIPPPLVMLITAAEMWALARFGASAGIGSFWTGALIVTAVCSGFALATAGLFDFKRADTTIHPTKPEETSALVVSGMYRYSRNPQYSAGIIGFMGAALLVNAWQLLLLCSLLVMLYLLLPFLEEPWLEATYGNAYLRYKQQTPRFLPTPLRRNNGR